MSNELREVLAHLRSDLGGGVRRNHVPVRGEPTSSPTSLSQDDEPPRGERRPPRQPVDDLRDMKFDRPKFKGNLNPDLFIEWMQALERFFEIKEYSDEKDFKAAVLKLKKYAFLWYENVKKQRAREGKLRIRTWSKLKKLMSKQFLLDNYKRDLYLIVSSLRQGRLSEKEYIREFDNSKSEVVWRRSPNRPWKGFLRALNQTLLKRLIFSLSGLLRMCVSCPLRWKGIPKVKGSLGAHLPSLMPHLNLTLHLNQR